MGSVALGGLKGVKRSLEVKVGAALTFTRRDGKSSGWKATGTHYQRIPRPSLQTPVMMRFVRIHEACNYTASMGCSVQRHDVIYT